MSDSDPICLTRRQAGLQQIIRFAHQGSLLGKCAQFLLQSLIFAHLTAQVCPSPPGENREAAAENGDRCQEFIELYFLPTGQPLKCPVRIAQDNCAANQGERSNNLPFDFDWPLL
jgi:hypothetical protein